MSEENNNDIVIAELKEIIQSANINFLLGSGVSKPFLPTLLNIEKDINKAVEDNDLDAQVTGYKEYLEKIMLPNKKIVSGKFSAEVYKDKKGTVIKNAKGKERSEAIDFQDTKDSYINFFKIFTKLILERKTTILSKQINIFTTNIDVFLETILEEIQLDYNDGFFGRLKPTFSLANFNKSIFQRSLHFDHKSEIPIFNIFKLHGSLTWKYKDAKNNKIILSTEIEQIQDDLNNKTGDEFIKEYKKNILVVNPENAKFSETVLNKYYYELLRFYSNELEKENSVLFVIGFSMEDQHIREITQRVAKSNPTLKIFIFLYSKNIEIGKIVKNNKQIMEEKMEIEKFQNITIVAPEYEKEEDKYNYDLETITDSIFGKINYKKEEDEK